jgi:hypothetical protein
VAHESSTIVRSENGREASLQKQETKTTQQLGSRFRSNREKERHVGKNVVADEKRARTKRSKISSNMITGL